MGSPTAPLDLTLSDIERSKSRPLRFLRLKAYISQRSLVRPMLLTLIHMKPYMGSPKALLHLAPLHLTLSDFERSN